MKNIRLYAYFVNNNKNKYKIKLLPISLSCNNSSHIYYHKTNIGKKMFVEGRERCFLLPKSRKKNFDKMVSKYGINRIDSRLLEFISLQRKNTTSEDNLIDIAKKNRYQMAVDSLIRRDFKEEVVSMYFDEDRNIKQLSNILWINQNR